MHSILSVVAFLAAAALAAPGMDPNLGITLGSPTQAPAAATSSSTSSAVPNPTSVTINSIAYGGTGCPQGSVGSFISADRTTFTLIFDSFVASIGPGVPITQNRVNCQLNLNLQYPSGFQYSILSTTFRGYAGLDKGVTGTQSATYYFSGLCDPTGTSAYSIFHPAATLQAATTSSFKGPSSGDYEISDAIPFTSTVWSPCGASLPLNINSQVRLASTVTSATGLMTEDSVDGKVEFQVGVQWQTC
ncbi:putative secreted protein [Lachnellula suecica]|uniref:Putative secreted protein n=1 Tax=Lachnellula suecica TaxID=602035 RepID=A0A8T9C3F5_9HELO|nr:putative secreted protein [Lachnellula suecica]